MRIKTVLVAIASLALAACSAWLGYSIGHRTGRADLSGLIAGSSDRAVINAIELEYERALGTLVRDLVRAKAEIAGGQEEIRSLRAELGASRRERDVARALLESYRDAATESFDSRDDGYQRLGELGDEFIRRLQGNDGGSGKPAAQP